MAQWGGLPEGVVFVLRHVLLSQNAVLHGQDPIAYGKQPLVMSDHHRCLAQLMGLICEQMGDVLSSSSVQGGGGLIRQNDVGVVVERHRNGGALAFTSGELGRISVCSSRDAKRFQQVVTPVVVILGACDPAMHGELVVEPQEGHQAGG